MLGMFPWERRRLACFCAATKSTRLQTGRLRSQRNCPGIDDVLPQLFWSGRREAISTGPGLRLQASLAGHLLPRRSEQLKRVYFVRAIPVGVVDDGLSGGRVHRCPGADHGFPGGPEIRRFGTHGHTDLRSCRHDGGHLRSTRGRPVGRATWLGAGTVDRARRWLRPGRDLVHVVLLGSTARTTRDASGRRLKCYLSRISPARCRWALREFAVPTAAADPFG